jgi:uncharacterized protein (TIGR00299 family) protein
MRILYLDGVAGVSGDMFVAALVGAGADEERVLADLARLGLPGVGYAFKTVRRGGLRALRFEVVYEESGRAVEEEGDEVHRGLAELVGLVRTAGLDGEVAGHAEEVLRLLAEAEGAVHGLAPGEVHFHEVGALDTVADAVAAASAFVSLRVSEAWAGPVTLGRGAVRTAHGLLPVPAPATLELLKGAPVRAGTCEGECATPTGAALLVHFCRGFSAIPPMKVERIGYGAGSRELPHPNVFRAVVGEAVPSA